MRSLDRLIVTVAHDGEVAEAGPGASVHRRHVVRILRMTKTTTAPAALGAGPAARRDRA
jgi:hypothetical protein